MSGFVLKIIACISMLVDHTAAVFEPQLTAVSPWLYVACRMFGRLAFPIFAMGIAEGVVHTSDSKKYLVRMLIFALIAQIPFSLLLGTKAATFTLTAFGRSIGVRAEFSVMVTLLLGLSVCVAIHEGKHLFGAFALLAAALLDAAVGMDYGVLGVLLIIGLYLARSSKPMRLLVVVLFAASLYFDPIKQYVVRLAEGRLASSIPTGVLYFGATALSSIFMLLYNKERGPRTGLLIYLFYPVHMILLWLIWLAAV